MLASASSDLHVALARFAAEYDVAGLRISASKSEVTVHSLRKVE